MSQITTSASRSRTVEGPNMGWMEATRQPARWSERIGSMSGVLMLAMSTTTPAGRLPAPFRVQLGDGGGRRRADDELRLRQRIACPRVLLGRGGWVESGGGEALGREKAPQPPAHAAGAADDHRALARAHGRQAQAVLLLHGHRGTDQPGDEVLGHFRIEPALPGEPRARAPSPFSPARNPPSRASAGASALPPAAPAPGAPPPAPRARDRRAGSARAGPPGSVLSFDDPTGLTARPPRPTLLAVSTAEC